VRINNRWLWIIFVLLGTTVLFAVRQMTRYRLPIRVAQVRRGEIVTSDTTNGVIEPRAKFEAFAPYSGTVKAVYVREGMIVPQGQLLVAMNDTEARTRLATALSGLRTAEADYDSVSRGGNQQERNTLAAELKRKETERKQAVDGLSRLRKLEPQGASSLSEIDGAQQQLAEIVASLHALEQRNKSSYSTVDIERARAALANAKEAYVAAKETLRQVDIYSPYAGTVYVLPFAAGEFVQRGEKLVEMADLTKVQVRAYFDEPEIGQLAVGMPASIAWDALPGRTWQGNVLQLPASIIAYSTRHVGAAIIFLNNPDRCLPPYANVKVTVTMSATENALIIPHEALRLSEKGDHFVYLVEGEHLRRAPVKVNATNLMQVQILDGLNEGQAVALGAFDGQPLADDVPIRQVR
jgi:HlyD family secretion protein